MPATMAGSRGGAIGKSHDTAWPAFVTRLLNGVVSFPELYERLRAPASPRTVTLVVNNTCNLRCRHCYLQVPRLDGAPLDDGEWARLVDSLIRVEPELVCLSGKEVLLGSTGMAVLRRLGQQRRAVGGTGYRLGFITNGTLMHRHRDALVEADPSYVDVSVDGLPDDHDAIRGAGAFAALLPNLRWAVRTFGPRLFVNLTLQKRNAGAVVDAVAFLHRLGVSNVELGFYRPLPYTDGTLALSASDVADVFDRLGELEAIPDGRRLRVLLDLDVATPAPLAAFLASRWFSFDAIRVDENLEPFVEYRLRNGVTLETRFAPYPVGISRSVRVTPEGHYLAAEDTIDTTGYATHSLGNVRDADYDFARLHATARRSARLHQLCRRFFADVLPRLVSAAARGRAGYVQERVASVA